VVYGDRDVQHTLRRLSETIDLKDALSMMSGVGMPDPPQVRRVLWLAGWLAAPCSAGGLVLVGPSPGLAATLPLPALPPAACFAPHY
jgi:hypothetical protein